VDLFAEMVRSGGRPTHGPERVIRGVRSRAPREEISQIETESEARPKKRAGRSR
jgi:hypothetical protein